MDLSPLVGDLAMGGFAGYCCGIAAKKVFRLAALFVGLYITSLIYLSEKGIITVQWDSVGLATDGILSKIWGLNLSVGVLGTGGALGFLAGWKSG